MRTDAVVALPDATPSSAVADGTAAIDALRDGTEASSIPPVDTALGNDASEGEANDPGDGTGRRRRGRRGGRRRRRGAGEGGAGNEAGASEDFGDDEQPQVIIANGSQPEFDFDDEAAPAAKPAARTPIVPPVATVATTGPDRPVEATIAPEPIAVTDLAANEPVAEALSPVDPSSGNVSPASPEAAESMSPAILKNDTVESFTMAESPAASGPAAIAALPAAPDAETPAAETPVVVTEPAKPAPVRPAVGNSGSLFFTADADTPSSVTRHLFEPVPAPQPAAVMVEKGEEHDLPLLADNDEASDEKKDLGSERSA